jgi:HEPN domain-containing protein
MANIKVASLLILAEEDLDLAAQPTTKPRPAAYHLAQAAEKAARAVCEHEGIAVGTSHNIGYIGALLPADHPMRDAIEAQNHHSPASTRYRYPDPAGRLPKEPPKERILQLVDEVRDFINLVKKHVYGSSPELPAGTKP